MKLQQLRYLVEVARQGLNVSEAAEKLHTSQPGISKQIRLLEDELGVQVFIRNGKRMVAVSEPGRQVLDIASTILREARNLKRVGEEFAREEEGELTIATTHTQARYALPVAVKAFRQRYPEVTLRIKQGIRSFLEENTEDISLAYLLKSLIKASRIKASTKYMAFHRSIEQFSQRHYGHDIPQKRYGEIKELTLNSPQRGSSYTKAKRIIDRWTDYFANNG